ncbi:hypothetical protein AAMO2058_000382300 [Amorphochlora amoebiformis]|uniref:Uncharacterized protein n=1 Tax=Amorphochlora amoebiformis TaxID=1561963 RepID=A0A7S0D626_9EUKA|mmetsp:Transcript_18767/g.29865  ORF Transcript_18767/g.29865 Transcript_18767/m.29865 type:complete len:444 (+) Transcript_18767:114-1445(+)
MGSFVSKKSKSSSPARPGDRDSNSNVTNPADKQVVEDTLRRQQMMGQRFGKATGKESRAYAHSDAVQRQGRSSTQVSIDSSSQKSTMKSPKFLSRDDPFMIRRSVFTLSDDHSMSLNDAIMSRDNMERTRNLSTGCCPKGHKLKHSVFDLTGYHCDICECQVSFLGVYDCRECDFCLCHNCFLVEGAPKIPVLAEDVVKVFARAIGVSARVGRVIMEYLWDHDSAIDFLYGNRSAWSTGIGDPRILYLFLSSNPRFKRKFPPLILRLQGKLKEVWAKFPEIVVREGDVEGEIMGSRVEDIVRIERGMDLKDSLAEDEKLECEAVAAYVKPYYDLCSTYRYLILHDTKSVKILTPWLPEAAELLENTLKVADLRLSAKEKTYTKFAEFVFRKDPKFQIQAFDEEGEKEESAEMKEEKEARILFQKALIRVVLRRSQRILDIARV